MTAVDTPDLSLAGRDHDPRSRPVPWRNLVWVTWRQHRGALTGVTALLGALAVYLLITGMRIHHAYAAVAACHPTGSLVCGNTSDNFLLNYPPTADLVAILLQAVPPLIGAFVGAPVLARELESGTFRFAWTQGFGRVRWTLGKLALLAILLTAETAAFGQLFTWYDRPFVSDGVRSPLAATAFDLRGLTFAAWTLAAFSIAVFAGVLIRRVVPAMAVALAAWTGLAVVTALQLREHYLTPLLTSNPSVAAANRNVPLVLKQYFTGPNGRPAPRSVLDQALSGYQPAVVRIGRVSIEKKPNPVPWLIQHGYTQWTSYQPASRFWPFQFIEAGWLLALSLLLIGATVALVHRRSN